MNQPVGIDVGRIIWATRGRTWGFRFLLRAGLSDPLPTYERVFGDEDEPTLWIPGRDGIALRFPDPLGRRDSAGRVIPHEFAILGSAGDGLDSVDAGIAACWPLVSSAYAEVWDAERPPSADAIDQAVRTR